MNNMVWFFVFQNKNNQHGHFKPFQTTITTSYISSPLYVCAMFLCLTHFKPMLHLHTLWKHHRRFLTLSGGYRDKTLPWKRIGIKKDIVTKWINPLSDKRTKWSNILKQFVGNSRRIVWVCLTILWGWAERVNKTNSREKKLPLFQTDYITESRIHLCYLWNK